MRGSFVWLVLLAPVLASVQEPTTRAHGTVNELMIGIVEPNTNAVGYAAFVDPEAPTDEPVSSGYPGWVRVESAAVAVAESANLLMIPGRLCSNGKPAPVDEENWIGWTEDLRAAGLAAYEAARNKNQEPLLDVSDQLAASCTGCHMQYLDVGGDSANRCMP